MSDIPDFRNIIPGVGFVAPSRPEEPEWKTNAKLSQEFLIDGRPTRLYTIGALASALGKKPVTLRKWIRTSVIPEAGMKTQAIERTLGDAGRRLFTEEQIESMVRIAREEGVAGEGQRPISHRESRFSSRVWALWRAKDW